MKHCISILFLLIITSCSGIQLLNQEDLYSQAFLKKLESARVIFKDGDKKVALAKLEAIADKDLSTEEIAKKYNLIGVFNFSQGNINEAIGFFDIAKKNVSKDLLLFNQIHLNLASSHFKNNNFDLAKAYLKDVQIDYLSDDEKNKFYKLNFSIAQQTNDTKQIVESLIHLSEGLKSFLEVEEYNYKDLLVDSFRTLSKAERVYLLEDKAKVNPYVVAYLGKIEATQRFYSGDREGAFSLIDWLKNKFSNLGEIQNFADTFTKRAENFSKVEMSSIGVLIPLSGKYERFGQNALLGISTALDQLKFKGSSPTLYVRDNKRNSHLSKRYVRELVASKKVSVIIGGLYPDLAREEYLEAKKYGVLYISISPVQLPKEQKNHLLIEVAGSIESQVEKLMDDRFLESVGRNVAVLYPDSDGGENYIDSIWDKSNMGKINLSGIGSYKKGIKEYLNPVKDLLGLKNSRERSEELKIWKDIYSQSKRNVRIVNYLKPIVDFDWVLLPSYPHEAIQIIPTFHYYDVKKVKFVGGPSWLSRKLLNERTNLGEMIFVGDDPNDFDPKFKSLYIAKNKKSPSLISTLGFEAMNLALGIVGKPEVAITKREVLEQKILSISQLQGVTSKWTLIDGKWLKELDLLKITRSGIVKWNPSIN